MESYRIENDILSAEIMAYGAIIKQLYLKKDKVPLVVSYPSAEDYTNNPMRVGASIGRYAGRIQNYSLNGKKVDLTEEAFVLHSADQGWDKKLWSVTSHQKEHLMLQLDCPQNEKGHPGNVSVTLVYRLVASSLEIEYSAQTDAPTPINPTQHSYFCFDELPIEEHQLQINAKNRLALGANLLPTGGKIKNHGNHFSGNTAPIGKAAYDDVFVIDDTQNPVAVLTSPGGKYALEVFTDQKCVVIFVSKALNGICFETQGYPNAPNFPHFPSTLLNPGETYRQKTRYCFTLNRN